MVWEGAGTQYSTIGRVAYAVGVGATDLTETLAMYQTMALELGIEDAEATAEKWRTIGAEQLNRELSTGSRRFISKAGRHTGSG